uniref:(northern house mosquito) hypothetical protein n=1 Tax=Culex pipiens TaxID=7175 RepID=A0A8D8F2G9_CULPI
MALEPAPHRRQVPHRVAVLRVPGGAAGRVLARSGQDAAGADLSQRRSHVRTAQVRNPHQSVVLRDAGDDGAVLVAGHLQTIRQLLVGGHSDRNRRLVSGQPVLLLGVYRAADAARVHQDKARDAKRRSTDTSYNARNVS